MKNKIKNIKVFTALILALLLVNGCETAVADKEESHHKEENHIELNKAQFKQAAIEFGTIERRMLAAAISVNGVIDVPPKSNVSINIPYGGFVKRIDVLPGSELEKGALVAVIENPEFIQFQQDYLEAVANQQYLKNEFDRQKELFDEKVASAKTFQEAQRNFLINEARIKTIKAKLQLIGYNLREIEKGNVSSSVNIYTPVSGAVRAVFTNVGKFIQPQDVLMEITNAEDLHVELTVYESDLPKVKKGQRILFTVSNSPDRYREAEVFLVGKAVREDRSVTVHGHLLKPAEDILPGMFISAKIETSAYEAFAVPEEAIVRFNSKHFLFAFDGMESDSMYVFKMLEVTLGNSEDGFTQISLSDSTTELSRIKLVTKGAYTLLAKAKNTEEEEGGHHH